MSRPRGSIVQFNWQDSPEGREYFAGILRRNRRKIFGLLEIPSLPMQSPPDIINYKIVLYGKPGIGKTSTIAKLSGQEIPLTHIETPGIQTTVIYWPVKLMSSSRVLMFRFQFWDCGDHAMKKYDHLLPVIELKYQYYITNRFDQFLHSDITEQELREFEEQWSVPVLKIANKDGPRLSDGRGLDGRAGILDVAPFLNTLAELLWQHEQTLASRQVSRNSSNSSRNSADRRIR
ncbi:ciliogenesis and planar polarity effector 2 [Exaiptasia diaphana]|uniref:Ciliogenesis and planar polarity effector 2 n=1 Tax=Exaiptasia diaphana TaxID=2652724 RepID=A0A913YWF9_EXADI|nr:ciliogenesis and planar polarity effector 2 [Exaiptasia diaphana]